MFSTLSDSPTLRHMMDQPCQSYQVLVIGNNSDATVQYVQSLSPQGSIIYHPDNSPSGIQGIYSLYDPTRRRTCRMLVANTPYLQNICHPEMGLIQSLVIVWDVSRDNVCYLRRVLARLDPYIPICVVIVNQALQQLSPEQLEILSRWLERSNITVVIHNLDHPPTRSYIPLYISQHM